MDLNGTLLLLVGSIRVMRDGTDYFSHWAFSTEWGFPQDWNIRFKRNVASSESSLL